MESFKKLIKNKTTLVFLDLEGTQFSHEIIALGACKCALDEKGNIKKRTQCKKFKIYVKPLGSIGKFVSSMTQINEQILKEEGFSFESALRKFNAFINQPLDKCAFIVFGSNDAKMILDSINYSQPKNAMIGYSIVNNCIDYQMFISQFIKDEHNNNYSLVNYLKVFNLEPVGISHDPLNDALDLKNLYIAFEKNKDIVLNEYLKVLNNSKIFPAPIKKIISKLSSGEDVTQSEFIKEIRKYLS
jgi:DNA polymerase III alpha subunit (gram-positive type)